MKNINLYNNLKEQAKKNPDKVLIADTTSEVSNKEMLLKVNVMAQKILQHTIGEKTVGIFLPNVVANVVVMFSLFKNQQTPAILNFTMGTQSILDCIEVAQVKTVISSRNFVKEGRLENVIDEMEKRVKVYYLEDLAKNISLKHKLKALAESKLPNFQKENLGELILYTSGTESTPKGVVLTHSNIYANIKQMIERAEVTEQDKIFNPLPLFHSFGITVGAMMPFVAGIRSYLFPSPLMGRKIVETVQKEQSTLFVATNSFFELYSRYATKENMGSLRIACAGAEKLKLPLKEFYRETVGIEICEGYGATEASPVIALGVPGCDKEGSVGKLLNGIDYKIEKVDGIEDGGNLLIKGPNIMKGYLIKGKGFVPQEGWYDTGDVVEIDADGYVFIKARLKRFSKIAGEMISLSLLEEVAVNGLKETNMFAVSVPDKKRGEKIVLFTTSENFDRKRFERELVDEIAKRQLSNLYVPYKIEWIEKVPLLGSGKPDYRKLEEMAKDVKKGLFK